MIFSYKNTTKLALSLGVLASTLFLTSCDKEEETTTKSSSETEIPSATLTRLASQLPKVKIVDNSKLRTFVNNEGITFIDAGDGFTFAEANGPTFSTSSGIRFTEGPSGSVILLDPNASGLGGGGTVVAGSSSLDINLAICYGSDERALDMGFGFGFNGVSAVIGISGDFAAITESASAPTEDDLKNMFNGFAGYYVFDDNANGSYKVMDIESLENEDEPSGVSFAFIIDIKNGYYYISKSGKLTVNGGSIAFNGDYYAMKFDFYGEDEEMGDNWKVVSGFGAMGCN